MEPEEFEQCRKISTYEDFMQTALGFENLTLQDYQDFMPVIFEICPRREEKDPFLMYERIIEELRERWTASETLPFHGPWHHGLVAGILVACLRNNGYNFSDSDIQEALKRGLMIPAGGCGFHGICGAGSGPGIATSIITRATPFHDGERSKALEINSESIRRVARLGGPRCCALSTYTALRYAGRELKKMGYEIPLSRVAGRCKGYYLNDQCHRRKCPYYPVNEDNTKSSNPC
jgi:hypothetical protein